MPQTNRLDKYPPSHKPHLHGQILHPHFVSSVEVLCDDLLLFLEVLDLDILLVEPPAAKHQSFIPPLAWQALALLVDIEIVLLLVPNEDRLALAAHVHIEMEHDMTVGTSDSSVGEATRNCKLWLLLALYTLSSNRICALLASFLKIAQDRNDAARESEGDEESEEAPVTSHQRDRIWGSCLVNGRGIDIPRGRAQGMEMAISSMQEVTPASWLEFINAGQAL
ncbi:hypothetical protein BC826DRAFT_972832 [Russula brevipes]|nr:hypothetical protein BC826DRAFT_972832 [Russula brevipes]